MPDPDNSLASTSNSKPRKLFVTLEMAERMINRFDGTKGKISEFIDNCDKAYSTIDPAYRPLLLTIIETRITDNARAMVKNRTYEDWNMLKNHLIDVYGEKRTLGQWQMELNSCRQGNNETVANFANRVGNCYIKSIGCLDHNKSIEARKSCIELLQNEALHVFISGLNSTLSLLVKSQRPTTIEDAIGIA